MRLSIIYYSASTALASYTSMGDGIALHGLMRGVAADHTLDHRRLLNNKAMQGLSILAVLSIASLFVCIVWYMIVLEWAKLQKFMKEQIMSKVVKVEKVHDDPEDLNSYIPAEKKDQRERAKLWKAGDKTSAQQAVIVGPVGPPAAASAKNFKPKKKKKEKKRRISEASSVGGSSKYLEVGARKSRHANHDGRSRLPPID
jgi:hypothetical protein